MTRPTCATGSRVAGLEAEKTELLCRRRVLLSRCSVLWTHRTEGRRVVLLRSRQRRLMMEEGLLAWWSPSRRASSLESKARVSALRRQHLGRLADLRRRVSRGSGNLLLQELMVLVMVMILMEERGCSLWGLRLGLLCTEEESLLASAGRVKRRRCSTSLSIVLVHNLASFSFVFLLMIRCSISQ